MVLFWIMLGLRYPKEKVTCLLLKGSIYRFQLGIWYMKNVLQQQLNVRLFYHHNYYWTYQFQNNKIWRRREGNFSFQNSDLNFNIFYRNFFKLRKIVSKYLLRAVKSPVQAEYNKHRVDCLKCSFLNFLGSDLQPFLIRLSNRWKLKLLIRDFENWTPRTVFPRESNGGDQRPIPITFGTTKTKAPDTPLLDGRPTWKKKGQFKIHIWSTGSQIFLKSQNTNKY